MEILGYLKKQPRWNIIFTEDGSISTGRQNIYGKGTMTAPIDVPIFRALLRYNDFYKTGSEFSVYFDARVTNEAASFNALKGINPTSYVASARPAMEIFNAMTRGKFDIHGDGWFTGIFTFSKHGNMISITVFNGDLKKERPLK